MRVYGIVRLTKKPEAQVVGGKDLVKCSVAWNGYKGTGNFVDIALWGKTALQFMNCEKGDRVLIKSATLSDNNYKNKEGQMVYQKLVTVEQFEYIEPKKLKDDLNNTQGNYQDSREVKNPTYEKTNNIDMYTEPRNPVIDVTEDDLPF